MEINLGPFSFRAYNDKSFGDVVIGYKGKHGLETAVRAGVRSQHLTLLNGQDNKDDVYTCPHTKKTYYGKTGLSPVSAKQVCAIEAAKYAALVAAEVKADNAIPVTATAVSDSPQFPVAC